MGPARTDYARHGSSLRLGGQRAGRGPQPAPAAGHVSRRRDSTAFAFLEGSLGLGYLPHPCVLFGSCDQTGLSFSHTLRLIRGKARWQAEFGYAGLLKDQDYFFSDQAYFPGFSGGARVKINPRLTVHLYTVGYLYRRTTLTGSLTGELTRVQSRHVLLWPGVSFLVFL